MARVPHKVRFPSADDGSVAKPPSLWGGGEGARGARGAVQPEHRGWCGFLQAALAASGEDFRILLKPDHYTLLRTQTHDGTPVPYAIYDSRRPGNPRVFCEDACADKPVLASGVVLLKRLFEME